MKHTPTPWIADCIGSSDAGENPVDVFDIGPEQRGVLMQRVATVAGNDAQFIVKAVNAHDELTAALRDVVNMHAMPDGMYRDMTGAMKRAREALAKAEAA